jgi:selenocysteine-specific elongation factor
VAKLIGTAGHVDHGKTTLIRALTGIDADRLPEEKARGMTIDIGFAYLDLPGLGRTSIVDVPGHEKFLSNMLAGALGVDVALLCVAADESVMPQTREHVAILKAIGVERFVVALTRADLADDRQRERAKQDVEELLGPVPVYLVNSVRGEGIEALREGLAEALRSTPERDAKGPWYLPIDRVFTLKGHGLIATGTLARGVVREGDAAVLQPGNLSVRVRSVQSHGQPVPRSEAGWRTALNLTGVKATDVRRGMAVGQPGALFESQVLDVDLRWVQVCKHGTRVRVAIGAEEAIGRIVLPSQAAGDFSPEGAKDAQLRLETPVACAAGQPLVVRRYSPPDLLAGGTVIVPQSKIRRRGQAKPAVSATPAETILAALDGNAEGLPTEDLCKLTSLSVQKIGDIIEDLRVRKKILGFGGRWFTPYGFRLGADRFLEALKELHEAQPRVQAQPKEKVAGRAGLPWSGKALDRIVAALVQAGKVATSGPGVRLPTFRLALSDKQRRFLDRVLDAIRAEPVSTPNAHQISQQLHVPIQAVEEILRLGIEAGELVSIGEGIWHTPEQLEAMVARVRQIAAGKPFSASQVRDGLGTTRKYVIPLLEYLDARQITVRRNETRVFRER